MARNSNIHIIPQFVAFGLEVMPNNVCCGQFYSKNGLGLEAKAHRFCSLLYRQKSGDKGEEMN
jgi:hypothetical protein